MFNYLPYKLQLSLASSLAPYPDLAYPRHVIFTSLPFAIAMRPQRCLQLASVTGRQPSVDPPRTALQSSVTCRCNRV